METNLENQPMRTIGQIVAAVGILLVLVLVAVEMKNDSKRSRSRTDRATGA